MVKKKQRNSDERAAMLAKRKLNRLNRTATSKYWSTNNKHPAKDEVLTINTGGNSR